MTEDRTIAEGVSVNPERMSGQPCIEGTRILTKAVKAFAAAGYGPERIIAEYPSLTHKRIADALAWEARPVSERRSLSRCIPASEWTKQPSVGH